MPIGLTQVSGVAGSLLLNLGAVFTMAIAVAIPLLGWTPSPPEIAGGLLMAIGVGMFVRGGMKRG